MLILTVMFVTLQQILASNVDLVSMSEMNIVNHAVQDVKIVPIQEAVMYAQKVGL